MGIATRLRNLCMGALLRGHFIASGPRGEKVIAITFDDGPIPVHTAAILDLLGANGACATFFLTGSHAESHPELVRRIADEGHELANHSYKHVAFARMPLANQLDEIERVDALLQARDGRELHWFRPPQGIMPPSLLVALMRRRHPVAMWSLDSLDYLGSGVQAILQRFESRPARNGEIVLFHDDNDGTVQALRALLPLWRDDGFRFATVSELAGGTPSSRERQRGSP